MDHQDLNDVGSFSPLVTEHGCQTRCILVANVWCRQMYFPKAGLMMEGHKHWFDHVTLVAHGAIRVSVNGVIRDYRAPCMLKIIAHAIHDITALEDETVCYCIHPIRQSGHVDDIVDPEHVPARPFPVAY